MSFLHQLRFQLSLQLQDPLPLLFFYILGIALLNFIVESYIEEKIIIFVFSCFVGETILGIALLNFIVESYIEEKIIIFVFSCFVVSFH